jgi:hypothetical protein
VERRHPGERDLVVELSMCRAHGRSLVGAVPAGLIGEVPPARDDPATRIDPGQVAQFLAVVRARLAEARKRHLMRRRV